MIWWKAKGAKGREDRAGKKPVVCRRFVLAGVSRCSLSLSLSLAREKISLFPRTRCDWQSRWPPDQNLPKEVLNTTKKQRGRQERKWLISIWSPDLLSVSIQLSKFFQPWPLLIFGRGRKKAEALSITSHPSPSTIPSSEVHSKSQPPEISTAPPPQQEWRRSVYLERSRSQPTGTPVAPSKAVKIPK